MEGLGLYSMESLRSKQKRIKIGQSWGETSVGFCYCNDSKKQQRDREEERNKRFMNSFSIDDSLSIN